MGDEAQADIPVGRQSDFARLEKRLAEAISGKGGVIFISGEAGLGKSRLMSELARKNEKSGVLLLRGRCLYQEGADPYLPFIDAFRDLRSQGGEARTISGDASIPVGMLGMGEPAALPRGPADGIRVADIGKERDRMYESVSSAIKGISARMPLMFVLDDLQWADSASLQLLVYLSRGLSSSRAIIVGAFRPEELTDIRGRPHPLRDALDKMRRDGAVEIVELQRLSRDDSGRLLSRILDGRELPEGFSETIFRQTDGNPFFIEEMVKGLRERDILAQDGRGFVLNSELAAAGLPSSIKTVIDQRLSRLDPDAVRTLEYGSIIGQEFSLDILRGISEMKEEKLIDAIDHLTRAQLLVEDLTGVRFYFASNMLREAVYGNISRSRKRILHRKTAAVIENLYPKKIDDHTYALAHHYNNAGDMARCSRYFNQAGRRALRSLALEEAGDYFRSAIESLRKLEPTPESLRLEEEVLLSLGSVDFNIGEWDRALEEFREVGELGREWGNDHSVGLSHLRIGEIFEKRSQWKLSNEHYSQALAIFESTKDEGGLARVYSAMGKVYWRTGDYARARESGTRGRDLAEKLGEKALAAMATIDLGNVYYDLGDFEQARRCQEEGFSRAREIDEPLEMARALNNLGNVEMKLERLDEAIAYFEKCVEQSYRSGNVRMVGFALSSIGECIARKGNVEKAMDYLDRALAIFQKIDEKLMISSNLTVRAIIYRNAGAWENAHKNHLESVRILEDLNLPFSLAERVLEFGITCRAQGQMRQAREHLHRALGIFEGIGAQQGVKKAASALKSLDGEKPAI